MNYEFLDDLELTATDMRVINYVSNSCNGLTSDTTGFLSTKFGVSTGTVTKAIKHLKELGYLDSTKESIDRGSVYNTRRVLRSKDTTLLRFDEDWYQHMNEFGMARVYNERTNTGVIFSKDVVAYKRLIAQLSTDEKEDIETQLNAIVKSCKWGVYIRNAFNWFKFREWEKPAYGNNGSMYVVIFKGVTYFVKSDAGHYEILLRQTAVVEQLMEGRDPKEIFWIMN